MQAKKNDFYNYTYFKDDHHYTYYGTFVSYNFFIDCIKKDFSNIKRATKDDFKISMKDYSSHCDINGCDVPVIPRYQKFSEKYYYYEPVLENKKDYNKNILVMGDSFTRYLEKFISMTFKDSKRTSDFYPSKKPTIKSIDKEITEYTKKGKVDIVLIYTKDDNLEHFLNWE
jgi:predicted HicB family RNase H-like nuclease